MGHSPEPRFAGIASMIGDPTRARMLAALMGGQYLAAGELAAAAGVTPQTASGHIGKLLDAELIVLRTQGRHRYVRIADEEVAHVLESLSVVGERRAAEGRWSQGAYRPLKAARTCFSHLAGELGVALYEGLVARGSLVARDGRLELSESGRADLERLGVTLPDAKARAPASRGIAYACVDWSERRDHLAGPLAVALLAHALKADWLRRTPGSRALRLTPAGSSAFAPWTGARPGDADAPAASPPALRAQLVSQPS